MSFFFAGASISNIQNNNWGKWPSGLRLVNKLEESRFKPHKALGQA